MQDPAARVAVAAGSGGEPAPKKARVKGAHGLAEKRPKSKGQQDGKREEKAQQQQQPQKQQKPQQEPPAEDLHHQLKR